MIVNMIKTKVGYYTLAALLIVTGLLLDSSGNVVAQSLHHVVFILSGITIGTVIANRR